MDLVLDAVKTRQKHSGERQIGVAGRIREPDFHPFSLRACRVGRDPDRCRAVPGRIREVDRRFKARGKPLVRIRGRVGECGERMRMLQNAADVVECQLAQACVAVAGEEGLTSYNFV